MKVFRGVYDWLERTLFETLNRKILGNFLPLLFFILVPALFWVCLRSRFEQVLASGGSPEEMTTALRALLDSGSFWFWLLAVGGLVMTVVNYLFLRFLMITPLKKMIAYFNSQTRRRSICPCRCRPLRVGNFRNWLRPTISFWKICAR